MYPALIIHAATRPVALSLTPHLALNMKTLTTFAAAAQPCCVNAIARIQWCNVAAWTALLRSHSDAALLLVQAGAAP